MEIFELANGRLVEIRLPAQSDQHTVTIKLLLKKKKRNCTLSLTQRVESHFWDFANPAYKLGRLHSSAARVWGLNQSHQLSPIWSPIYYIININVSLTINTVKKRSIAGVRGKVKNGRHRGSGRRSRWCSSWFSIAIVFCWTQAQEEKQQPHQS